MGRIYAAVGAVLSSGWGVQTFVLLAALTSFWPWGTPLTSENAIKNNEPNPAVSLASVVSLVLLVPLLLEWVVKIIGRFLAEDAGGSRSISWETTM